jgi:hypothetical protein
MNEYLHMIMTDIDAQLMYTNPLQLISQGTESILATDFCLHNLLLTPFQLTLNNRDGIYTPNDTTYRLQGDACIYHGERGICSH